MDDRVAEDFKALPPKISANMTHIFKLLRLCGNQVGEPQTKSLGDIRVKFGRYAINGIMQPL